jgi:hypothetical protein
VKATQHAQVHNGSLGMAAKAELRRRVLEHVQPASVFDGFAGRGEMYWAAWHDAPAYIGCDLTWELTDPGRRFAADNRRVLRSIDLQQFSVFDFDAFDSPWEQMVILAARRKWAPGERGAVVLTDGTSLKGRFGGADKALALLCGIKRLSGLAPTDASSKAQQSIALTAWCRRACVTPLKLWKAEGRSERMVYTALVFEGNRVTAQPLDPKTLN